MASFEEQEKPKTDTFKEEEGEKKQDYTFYSFPLPSFRFAIRGIPIRQASLSLSLSGAKYFSSAGKKGEKNRGEKRTKYLYNCKCPLKKSVLGGKSRNLPTSFETGGTACLGVLFIFPAQVSSRTKGKSLSPPLFF